MGSCLSGSVALVMGAPQAELQHFFVPNEKKPGQGADAQRDFARLRLDKHTVDRFFDLFVSIDKDGTSVIDLDEFYRFFQIDRSPFADRVFSIMDVDSSGELSFREFVVCMWNYCSLDLRALVRFTFDLFDRDLSGFLDVSEVYELLAEVYGDSYEQNHRLKLLFEELDSNGDNKIAFDEFRNINQRYPSLLFPAFRMQRSLRERVFGEEFWNEQLKQRIKMGASASPSIWEILDAVDEARKAMREETRAKVEATRWKPPGAVTLGYRPTPSLSDMGKKNPAVAQMELLERAERGWRERVQRAAEEGDGKRPARARGAGEDAGDAARGGGREGGASVPNIKERLKSELKGDAAAVSMMIADSGTFVDRAGGRANVVDLDAADSSSAARDRLNRRLQRSIAFAGRGQDLA